MYAKIVCFALVFATCEFADLPANGNIPGSIPIGPNSNLPSSDQSEISNSPNNLQNDVQSEQKPNIPNNIQNTGPAGQSPSENGQNNMPWAQFLGMINNGQIDPSQLPSGPFPNFPNNMQGNNNMPWAQFLSFLNNAQNNGQSGQGSSNSNNNNGQNTAVRDPIFYTINRFLIDDQSLSNMASGKQETNSGSQSGDNGNTGSQTGNNGSTGSQSDNNSNTGLQSSNGNSGLQGGNNGNNGQNNNSGSQNSNNGNSASQNSNNGNSGSQSGSSGSQNSNNGNNASQNSNNGNSGSQSGSNNSNTGSLVGNNDNSSPMGNDNGVSGESSNAGSQSGTNTNTGSQVEDVGVDRPCMFSFEECIREYFAQNSKCKEVNGHVPDPYIRPVSTTFLSRVNLTLSATDVIYSGLNGNIEEFSVNKDTDRLVITIQFRNVTYYSKDTFYRFHRRAQEPVVNVDYFFANFRSFSTTTVIPVIDDLRLDKSETVAFVDDANPRINFGPKAFVSSDPGVRSRLPEILADKYIIIQEFFLTEAAFIAATYIQHNICDFGLKVL